MAQPPGPAGDDRDRQPPSPPGWDPWQQPPGSAAPSDPFPGSRAPAPYAGAAVAPAPSNTLSLIAMIAGIVSVVASCLCFVSMPTGVAAVIMGVIARGQIARSGGAQGGRGMAVAGILTGGAGAAIGALFLILWLAGSIAANLNSY